MTKGVYCNFLCIIMSEKTYCQRNRGVILNRAKDFYENDKERLREQVRDKQRIYAKKKKNK